MSASDFEERVVTVPLREAKKKSQNQRAGVAMRVIREHLAQHFNVDEDDVRLDPAINEAIWDGGRGNTPSSLRVRAARFVEEGEATVEAEPAE